MWQWYLSASTCVSCGVVGSVPNLSVCLWTSALWCCMVAVQLSFSVCVKVFPHPLWICLELFISVIVQLVDFLLYIVQQLMGVSNLYWSLVYGHLLVSYVLSFCLRQLCILCFAAVLVPGITVFPPMGCNVTSLVLYCISIKRMRLPYSFWY